MNEDKRLINILSMAQRAGKVVSGSFLINEAIKKNNVYFLIIASDIEENSYKNLSEAAVKNNIPFKVTLDKISLGETIGKEYRAAAAITDKGFAKAVQKIYDNESK